MKQPRYRYKPIDYKGGNSHILGSIYFDDDDNMIFVFDKDFEDTHSFNALCDDIATQRTAADPSVCAILAQLFPNRLQEIERLTLALSKHKLIYADN